MPAPLDPVIEKIIPLLPLRDPRVMTPQSARDALRQLAASRADVPPPPVEHVKEIAVAGGAGPVPARAYRNGEGEAPTIVFFHGGGWVAGDLETHDRQARNLVIETGAFPARSRTPLRRRATSSAASTSSAAMKAASASPATAPAAISQPAPRSPAAMPAFRLRDNCWSIPSPTCGAISLMRPRTRVFLRARRMPKAISSRATRCSGFAATTSRTRPTAPTGASPRSAPNS